MLKFLVNDNKPTVLVITPLRVGDTVSRSTKISIKRTGASLLWVSWEGPENVAKNTQDCYDFMKRHNDVAFRTLKYIIKIDNDIESSRNMIDKMVQTLESSKDNVGYTYCDFVYVGAVNQKFIALPFSIEKLCRCNYISSNSMLKIKTLDLVNGFVVDDKYKRLLDWAMWLKMYTFGFVGVPTSNTSFVAHTSKDSVSAGGQDDYVLKHYNVTEDFVNPIRNR